MEYNYNKLWKLLIDKKLMKKDLMEKTGITSSTIAYITIQSYTYFAENLHTHRFVFPHFGDGR